MPIRGTSFRQPDDVRGVYKPRGRKSEPGARDIVPRTLPSTKGRPPHPPSTKFNVVDYTPPPGLKPKPSRILNVLGPAAPYVFWIPLALLYASIVVSIFDSQLEPLVPACWLYMIAGGILHITWLLEGSRRQVGTKIERYLAFWWLGLVGTIGLIFLTALLGTLLNALGAGMV